MTAAQQLAGFFFQSAAKAPDLVALRFYDTTVGDWTSLTWREYEARVRKVAGWLIAQGLKAGDRIVILSANRPEWLIVDLAISAMGAISVPIYATSTAKDINYILEHSEAAALFYDQPKRLAGVNRLPPLLVGFDAPSAHEPSPGLSFASVLESQVEALQSLVPVKAEDIATIIYTSGTTGLPKGVIHSHESLTSTFKPVAVLLAENRTEPDRFFSFLPLSHVAERVLVEIGSICSASEVVFARSVDTLMEDLAKYPPTILLCVPRLWERVYERISSGLETASIVRKAVFKLASTAGSSRIVGNRILKARDACLGARFADTLVGRKLKERLGMHRVRIFITGSAPTRPEILRFFAKFGIFIREVYGLTENLCLGCYVPSDAIALGSCGGAVPGNSIKIASDGEVLFRAPWNFKGYYKDEEATRLAFVEGDWFATGDLGTLGADGLLRLTGRKKEILKTSTGKYVAPIPLEDALKELPAVAEAMMVGDNQKYCIALVALDSSKASPQELEDLLREHLTKVNDGRAHHETIKRLGVLRDGFSIENGLLTPTLKVKRQVVLTKYNDFIARVYQSTELIVRE